MITIDINLLKELFAYNPITGKLTRLKWGAGKEAGTIVTPKGSKTSYIQVSVKDKLFRAHRIIWAMWYGEWPDYIDHIDGNGLNNSITNLRSVSDSENKKNGSLQINNNTGISGVSLRSDNNKFSAAIYIDGIKKHLGCYETLFEAACARKSAELVHGFHPNHGRIQAAQEEK